MITESPTTALSAQQVSKAVQLPSGESLQLLHELSICVEAGESVAIQGRSGSGKTTLLSILGLLNPVDSGRLLIGGQDVTDLTASELARVRNDRVGFVFQNYSLIPHLTALQNVQLPLLYGSALPPGQFTSRAAECLDMVELADRAGSYPAELSGGEQQRVAIARALVRHPAVVLADEPTGALDESTANHVLDALIGEVARSSAVLVIVTHDPLIAARADRRYLLAQGRLGGVAA